MAKRLLTLSLLIGMAGLVIAAHQWFGWHYWDPKQQFSPFHHEGVALFLFILAMGVAIASFLVGKKRGT